MTAEVHEQRKDYREEGRLVRIEAMVTKIYECIHGNGNEGLKAMVFRHEEAISNMSDDRRQWLGLKVAIAVAIFSSLVSIAIAVLR